MANALYDFGRNLFARGELHWKTGGDTFRAMLIDTDIYTPDLANDDYLADVPDAARVGNGGGSGYAQGAALGVIDPVAGICDASDTVITVVPAGGPYEAILIYKEGASENDSPLVALIDSAPGLPVTADGSDEQIVWDDGANKIFKL